MYNKRKWRNASSTYLTCIFIESYSCVSQSKCKDENGKMWKWVKWYACSVLQGLNQFSYYMERLDFVCWICKVFCWKYIVSVCIAWLFQWHDMDNSFNGKRETLVAFPRCLIHNKSWNIGPGMWCPVSILFPQFFGIIFCSNFCVFIFIFFLYMSHNSLIISR